MSLHEEVKKIYETYCLDESIDKIKFDPFIVEEIQSSKWNQKKNVFEVVVFFFWMVLDVE